METENGLKEFLSHCTPRYLFPSTGNTPDTPIAITKAVKANEMRLGDITPKRPPAYDLEETYRIVREHWRRHRNLDGVERRHLKRIPWVLFYPPKSEDDWLGFDSGFTETYLNWLKGSRRASCIYSLAISVLQTYPDEQESFALWLKGIGSSLNHSNSVRLRCLRDRHSRYGLLRRSGPKEFAKEYLTSTLSPEDFEQDADPRNDLAYSGFFRRVQSELLRVSRRGLDDGEMATGELDRVLGFAVAQEDLRFRDTSRDLAESLLLPFVSKTPEPEVQESIQRFLLGHVGDPRISNESWQGIDEDAKKVMFRWMVGATLEEFFGLLDKTALKHQWKFRRQFWMDYYKQGVITDAWLILGKKAKARAWDMKQAAFGRFGSGSSVSSDQSALIMKMGGMTIVEWSHNGTCRLWTRYHQSHPKCYESIYSAYELRPTNDESYVHLIAHRGNWQRRIARFIFDQTRISRVRE